MPGFNNDGHQYSPWTGLVYVFNLIVGTGALALPAAFSRAGWALGIGFMILLSFISFMTVTFMIEAMSVANAILAQKRREKESEDSASEHGSRILYDSGGVRERDPLIPNAFGTGSDEIRQNSNFTSIFELKQRVEMGRMASMFFSRVGLYLFYLCICIYLYGDLAIYITAVAKTVRDVSCTYVPTPNNGTNSTFSAGIDININNTINGLTLCWSEFDGITRNGAYRLFSILFILALGPFCFFNVTKTKYLQLFTSVMRWTAFIVMVGLASKLLIQNGPQGSPPVARVSALPNLFGVGVYSFMCHHSLPSLITPIHPKRRILSLFSADYLLITIFYLLLSLTGIFAFKNIEDLYTLNFEPKKFVHSGYLALAIQYFLSLFPVFTLSTNFPIIAITLKNNLKSLFHIIDEEDEDMCDAEEETTTEDNDDEDESGRSGYPRLPPVPVPVRYSRQPGSIFCKLLSKVGFPFLAILPPFLLALFVEDVQSLVSFTGSYAGAGIQYIFPIFLVFHARKRYLCSGNPYASPFKHVGWLWFVLAWSVVSIGFVSIYSLKELSDNST